MDTEYTSWEGSLQRNWSQPNEHREIVQIAAIRIDTNSLKELKQFSILISPHINSKLSTYFMNLTGIDQEMLSEANSVYEGFLKYKDFIKENLVYACGNEGEIFSENLQLSNISEFGELTEVNNLRKWFCNNGLNANKIPSSGDLHKKLGIKLAGSTHNALHDVRSILTSVKHLVKKGADNPF